MVSPGSKVGAALARGAFRVGPSKAAAGVALLGASAGLLYAHSVEPHNVEVICVSLMLPRLPAEFDRYRIAQISDIHMDGWMTFERLCKLAKLVNEQGADLIAVTGDFVTAKAKYVDRELIDRKVPAILGIFVPRSWVQHTHWPSSRSSAGTSPARTASKSAALEPGPRPPAPPGLP